MNDATRGSAEAPRTSTALVSALRCLLRPLVRLLLAHRISFPFLAGLLKATYVQVASEERVIEGRRQTDSRVSLLTGIHRKEVKRLRAEPAHDDTLPESVDLGTQLAQRWLNTPEYQDADGHPLPLPRSSRVPGDPSFDQLVEEVSKDIRPRAVLDNWLDLGIVRMDSKRRVCLRVEGFVPQSGFEEKCFYLGRNVRDHVAAIEHNLRGSPPFFERSVFYESLSAASIQELEVLSDRLLMESLRQLDRRAADLRARDCQGADRRYRITIGAYLYFGSDAESQGAAPDPDERRNQPA